jgi:hypothetical protein
METSPWAFAVIGGPILLGLVMAWAKWGAGKRNRQVDPTRSADDPASGAPPRQT